MAKKQVSGFAYTNLPTRFIAEYRDGSWNNGRLTLGGSVRLSESAGVLQYAQTCFEGLKAFRTKDGHIVCFRPDLNEQRMQDSCARMMIPALPEGMFLRAIDEVVRTNKRFVPSYEEKGSMYLRPFAFGSGPVMGVKPAKEYEFRVFGSPVGNYFTGGLRALKLRICDLDRAAPHGTGHIKAGLNYAMSLYAITEAHELGYDENLYLDSATRTFVEETGGANIIFITHDGKLVTPKSDTILPSITRRSLLVVAQKYLGIEVEERQIRADELGDFAECGLCGTAAVISPVGSIDDHGKVYTYATTEPTEDRTLVKLLRTLRAIQLCEIEAPEGWIRTIC